MILQLFLHILLLKMNMSNFKKVVEIKKKFMALSVKLFGMYIVLAETPLNASRVSLGR